MTTKAMRNAPRVRLAGSAVIRGVWLVEEK